MNTPDNSDNPYRSPVAVAPVRESARTQDDLDDPVATLKKCRQQIEALGAAWMLASVFSGMMALCAVASDGQAGSNWLLSTAAIALAIATFGVGVLTVRKNLAAVRWGLALTYFLLLFQFVAILCGAFGQLISVVLLPLIAGQAHRVLRWAQQLRQRGIALNAKPEALLHLTGVADPSRSGVPPFSQ